MIEGGTFLPQRLASSCLVPLCPSLLLKQHMRCLGKVALRLTQQWILVTRKSLRTVRSRCQRLAILTTASIKQARVTDVSSDDPSTLCP